MVHVKLKKLTGPKCCSHVVGILWCLKLWEEQDLSEGSRRAEQQGKEALVKEHFDFWRQTAAAAAAKSLQSCATLCDPIDGSAPGSPVPGILQARVLEEVAISFSSA